MFDTRGYAVDLIGILKDVPMFADLDETQLGRIAGTASAGKFADGDTLFEEGSEAREFYVITSGAVAINKNVAGGRKRNLDNLGPGDIIGEIALYDAEPRSADAEALEDTHVLVFPNDVFLKLMADDHALASNIQSKIIRVLCARLRDRKSVV